MNSRYLREDVFEWLIDVGHAFFTGLVSGTLVVLAVVLTVNGVRSPGVRRYAAVLIAAAVASAAGSVFVVGYDTDWTWAPEPMPGVTMTTSRWFFSTWPRYLLLSCLFAIAFLYLREKHDSEREMRRLDEERAQFEQRTTEAVLQRLQAQIEPHFLFNTLAHVKRLYQTDSATGAAMLDKLMRYLAEALPQMREPQSTIAREIALTEAYIGIQQIRMGRRLRFNLEVDNDIANAQMPPMMLLTLVENAIKHGLSPLPEGGTITVHAARERSQLVVSVVDDGQGFTSQSGTGTGLANVRARLSALHGAAAQLALSANRPRGVAATLRLPVAAGRG